jgi:hypothetical protein
MNFISEFAKTQEFLRTGNSAGYTRALLFRMHVVEQKNAGLGKARVPAFSFDPILNPLISRGV